MDTSAPIVLGLIVDPSPRNVGAAYLPQRDETRFRTTADRLRGWRAWSRNIEGASEEYGPLPPNWFGTDHAPTVRITEETSAGAVKGQKCLHWGKGLCPEGEELRPFPLAKDPNTRGGSSYYAGDRDCASSFFPRVYRIARRGYLPGVEWGDASGRGDPDIGGGHIPAHRIYTDLSKAWKAAHRWAEESAEAEREYQEREERAERMRDRKKREEAREKKKAEQAERRRTVVDALAHVRSALETSQEAGGGIYFSWAGDLLRRVEEAEKALPALLDSKEEEEGGNDEE